MAKQEILRHKATIETLINTTAVLCTGTASGLLVLDGLTWDNIAKAIVLVIFGAGLEFLKYWGRNQNLW